MKRRVAGKARIEGPRPSGAERSRAGPMEVQDHHTPDRWRTRRRDGVGGFKMYKMTRKPLYLSGTYKIRTASFASLSVEEAIHSQTNRNHWTFSCRCASRDINGVQVATGFRKDSEKDHLYNTSTELAQRPPALFGVSTRDPQYHAPYRLSRAPSFVT